MSEPFRVMCDRCGQYCVDVVIEKIAYPLTGEMFTPRSNPYVPWRLPFEKHHGPENLRCPLCRRQFFLEGQKLLDLEGQAWTAGQIADPKLRRLGRPPQKRQKVDEEAA